MRSNSSKNSNGIYCYCSFKPDNNLIEYSEKFRFPSELVKVVRDNIIRMGGNIRKKT